MTSSLGGLSTHSQNAVTGAHSMSNKAELEKDMTLSRTQHLFPGQTAWWKEHRAGTQALSLADTSPWAVGKCLKLGVSGFPQACAWGPAKLHSA